MLQLGPLCFSTYPIIHYQGYEHVTCRFPKLLGPPVLLWLPAFRQFPGTSARGSGLAGSWCTVLAAMPILFFKGHPAHISIHQGLCVLASATQGV